MEPSKEAEFDDFAKEYTYTKQFPFRGIEEYTFLHILGNPAKLSCLELGCGDGHYSRILKRAQAANVIGVDISSKMIKLAREKDAEESLGCNFMVHDVRTLSISYHPPFDLVIAPFIFNYAKNFEELKTFCRVAFQHLKPGGKLVSLNDNPFDKPEYYESHRTYGVVKHGNPEREGDEVWYGVINPNGTNYKFANFYFPPERYVEAFEAAGFVNFQWQPLILSPLEDTDEKRGYWKSFIDHAPTICFSAYRPMM